VLGSSTLDGKWPNKGYGRAFGEGLSQESYLNGLNLWLCKKEFPILSTNAEDNLCKEEELCVQDEG